MSFSINTNLAANTALNNVTTTQNNLNNSITELSTGLKINSAADNPAGLIISERFQAQIGGLNQAITNSQDAVNYAKTADGGLSQISSLLQSARSLAVAAANNATLTSSALQADQSELGSIASSITSISQTTQYGTKNLLDGSAGTSASITDGTAISGLNIGGTFGSSSLSTGGTITLASLTSATQASVSSATFSFATSTVSAAGTFAINGTTFTTSTSSTASDIVNQVNAASGQTGVEASYTTGGSIKFSTENYGAGAKINISDASGTVLSAAGSSSATGTSAAATVTIGSTTVNFTGGSAGSDGLTLSDASGNQITLTQLGNATTLPAGVAIGQVSVGTSQFQVGADAGQTAQLSLGNFAASQLGGGAVSGLNMSNLDLTTATGASNAIQVIDSAINQVSSAQGQIGNFQSNVLDVDINQLTTQSQNLQASNSSIMDANIAQVMTSYTQQQILEQSGISVLGQANQASQNILSLIKGG
jgi:flagellin